MCSAGFAAGVGKIAGRVVDENGDGVLGANVQILETQQGVSVTELDGSFVILGVLPGRYTVRIGSIGFVPQTFVAVEVCADRDSEVIAAILVEEQVICCIDSIVCRRRPKHVQLDEIDRVQRYTQRGLQPLPIW